MSKHTPGPWMVEHPHGEPGVYIGAADTALVAKVYDADQGSAQTEANARLIAAAPEMLAILRDLMSIWDEGQDVPVWDEITDKVRAVLAKVKGEESDR